MQKFDAALLSTHLNALAETFDRKPVSPKALEVWFDTLREFPTERVMGLLIGWPKAHAKFPAPADIWKSANEICLADRERSAELQKRVAREPLKFERTEAGRRAGIEVRKLLRSGRIKPLSHWKKVLVESRPESIGHRYATEAIGLLERKSQVFREPGQDEAEEQN